MTSQQTPQETPQTLKLNFIAASDRGLVRGNNEDSAYAGPHLLVLADGMGGHAAGEVASQLMVEHMEHLDRDPEDADILALLGAAANDANASIARSVRDNPERDGMGTTLTALMFGGHHAGLIHVGDSRGYLLREGSLTQITEDDTFVQSLVKEGKLDPADVSSHPQKSLILKAYTGREVEPHLEMIPVKPGDRFLLCSDGLSDPVTASTIEETLSHGTPEAAAHRLIELALRSGGPDNITVIIADVVDATAGEATAQLPTAPAIAGALVPDVEPTHPDSAASRAAALMRTPHAAAPKKQAPHSAPKEKGEATSRTHVDPDEEEAHRQSQRARGMKNTAMTWIVAVLVLAIAGVGTLAWLDSRAEDTYFVAANANKEITIQRAEGTLLGTSEEHIEIQVACISEKNELRITSTGDIPDDCTIFTTEDLPPSQQAAMEGFQGGTYDDAVGLLNRLAEGALPVCVNKPVADKKSAGAKKDSAGAQKDGQNQTTDEQHQRPGKCREVK